MLLTGRYATRFGFEFTPTPDGFGAILQQLISSDPMPRKFQFFDRDDVAGADIPFMQRGLPPEEITLAEELKAKGYRTLHIGKWHLGRKSPYAPQDQGFDESLLEEMRTFYRNRIKAQGCSVDF